MKILRHLVPILIFVSAFGMPSGARATLTLLSNLPSNDGGGGGVSSSELRAVTFTTLASSFLITEVRMRLVNYQTPADVAELSLHLNGTNAPGTQIGSFISPSSSTNSAEDFAFSTTGIQLNPNTTYWLVIKATSSSVAFTWNRSNPSVTPPTTVFASFGEQWIKENDQSSWAIGTNGAHSLSISGVPEPEITAWIFAIGIFALLGFRESRRRNLFSQEAI